MAEQASSFGNIPNNTHRLWYKDPCLKRNITECLGLCLVIFYLGYDASLLNSLQAITAWREFLDYPRGPVLGLYTAILYLPSILTAYLGDFVSQNYGRRLALALGSFLVLVGSFINALAVNPGMWIAGRTIMGAGGGIAKVAAPALIQEVAHPRLRPMLASCYYPFFYFGSLLSALLCFAGLYIPGGWLWRMPSMIQVLGPSLVLATLINCPESPRWLVYKNRLAEACDVLSKHHANGVVDDPLVQWELAEIQAAIEEERFRSQPSYLSFFKTVGNRKRLVVIH